MMANAEISSKNIFILNTLFFIKAV
jgi:hypothetical protein